MVEPEAKSETRQMPSVLNRASVVALVLYLILMSLSFSIFSEIRFGRYGSSVSETGGVDVSGEIFYIRGGEADLFGYSNAFVIGKANFRTSRKGSVYSDNILKEIIAGKIKRDPIRWQINWDAFLVEFLKLWLLVAAVIWIRRKWTGTPQPSQ